MYGCHLCKDYNHFGIKFMNPDLQLPCPGKICVNTAEKDMWGFIKHRRVDRQWWSAEKSEVRWKETPKRPHVHDMNMAPEEGIQSRIRNLKEENTHTITVLPMGFISSQEWKEHNMRGPFTLSFCHFFLK